MKRLSRMKLLILVVATGTFFTLTGCKKDKNNDPTNPNNNVWSFGSLNAKVDGTTWSPKSVYAADSSGLGLFFIIAANDNSGTGYPAMFLVFPDNTSEGSTIPFNISQSVMMQYIENTTNAYWAEPAFGGSGSVTITKFNKSTKHVEGTFNGVAKMSSGTTTKNISNGSFSVNY